MGMLRFRIPSGATPESVRDLDQSCVAGGYDNMPAPTQVTVEGGRLTLNRESSESGYPVIPWVIPGRGHFMWSGATLMERDQPYDLLVELARGKTTQLRCQSAEWQALGMEFNPTLEEELRDLSRKFSHLVTLSSGAQTDRDAETTLIAGYDLANRLVDDYCRQILQARHSRQAKLDSSLGVRMTGMPAQASVSTVTSAVTTIHATMTWKSVEPNESNYQWERVDKLLNWAEGQGLQLVAGPLIDLSPRGLPDWLWLWEGDLQSIASFMCDYVGTAVSRYRGRIRRWHLVSGANIAGILKLGEEDLLWLTARLAEAAWQVDPDVELVIGLAQPWGRYL